MIGLASIASNPMAQRALIVAIIVALFFLWLAGHDDAVRKLERARSERKARLKQQQIKEKSNETSKQVAAARSDIRNSPDRASHELHDDEFEQLFGYRRDSNGSTG